jgi:hypothetical protein
MEWFLLKGLRGGEAMLLREKEREREREYFFFPLNKLQSLFKLAKQW